MHQTSYRKVKVFTAGKQITTNTGCHMTIKNTKMSDKLDNR